MGATDDAPNPAASSLTCRHVLSTPFVHHNGNL